MRKFEVNQNLSNSSIGDHNCIYKANVTKITEKSVTIHDNEGQRRCKIHIDEFGNEYIFPFGRYSMATIYRA